MEKVINSIKRVILKRFRKGENVTTVKKWLLHLKNEVWVNAPGLQKKIEKIIKNLKNYKKYAKALENLQELKEGLK